MRRRAAPLIVLSALTAFLSVAVTASPHAVPQTTAAPASRPMRVALLVDTSDGIGTAMTQIRNAVVAFADALPPEHELLLVATGRRTQVRVPPTLDRKKVEDSARGLTSDHGTTPLMDALLEVDERFLQKAGDRVPALVVLTGDGGESSATSEQQFNKWLNAMTTRHMLFEAVVLKFKGNGLPEAIVDSVAQATRGHVETTTVVNALADKMKSLAAKLAHERVD
jgi:hypothetical protein